MDGEEANGFVSCTAPPPGRKVDDMTWRGIKSPASRQFRLTVFFPRVDRLTTAPYETLDTVYSDEPRGQNVNFSSSLTKVSLRPRSHGIPPLDAHLDTSNLERLAGVYPRWETEAVELALLGRASR